jgi:flagellar motor switch protein FliG
VVPMCRADLKNVSMPCLTGPEKAAVFLLTMGEDFTSQVFRCLDEEEIRIIGRQMIRIDRVEKEALSGLLEELKLGAGSEGIVLSGNEVLEQALRRAWQADKANALLEDIRADWKVNLFQKARKLEPKVLANFLSSEHPQTVALVLSVLDHRQAAAVLAFLREDIQVDVILRMAELDKVSPEVLLELDRILQDELVSVEGTEGQPLGGIRAVAGILNNAARGLELTILDGIEEQSESLADEIRRLMFVFEDLMVVTDRGIMAILKEVSTDDLKMALRTASDELKEKFFKNMSSRAVEMLKEDMELMGPVRVRDVETAQQIILKAAKRLEQEGKIQLMAGGGGDEYV